MADADCIAGYYCLSGNCTAKVTNGGGCSADNQCLSTVCGVGAPRICVNCISDRQCRNPQPSCISSFTGGCTTCQASSSAGNAQCQGGGWGVQCNVNGKCVCG